MVLAREGRNRLQPKLVMGVKLKDSINQERARYSFREDPSQIIRNWKSRDVSKIIRHRANQDLLKFNFSA